MKHPALLWCLGAVPVLAVAGVVLFPPNRSPLGTVACLAVASLASWEFARRIRPTRAAWKAVIALALLARVFALFLEPSDDLHRYLWEGKIQWQGHNPYRLAPNDPALDGIADDQRAGVNHPEMTAIYGPLTLLFDALVAKVRYSPWSFKLAFLLLDLLLLRLVSTKLSACAAYGLSAIPLVFVAGFAHNEVLWVLPFVAGLRLLTMRRFGAAALTFGVAVGIKPTAAVAVLFVLPAMPPTRWPLIAIAPLIAVVPFLDAGAGLGRSLVRLGVSFEYNDLWPFVASRLLRPLVTTATADIVSRLAGVLVLFTVWWRARSRHPWDAALAGMTAWILVSPTVHPWYALILAALGARRLNAPGWWLCFGMGFYYVNQIETNRIGTWTEIPWVRALVYGPMLIALAAGWIGSKFRRPEREVSLQPRIPSHTNPEA